MQRTAPKSCHSEEQRDVGISCKAVSCADMYINIVQPKCTMLIGAQKKETAMLEIATAKASQ